jgi:diguanylate cyclase (GGDEF)-like protein/PAS domain S-box-containing protein
VKRHSKSALSVLAIASILVAIATSTGLALWQTREQNTALRSLQSSGRLKSDLDQLQQIMLDAHGDLYTQISTAPFYHRQQYAFPLRALLALTVDARSACGSRPTCISQLDDLDGMLRLLAKRSDALGARANMRAGGVGLGDPALGEIDAYFYSALEHVGSVRVQSDATIEVTVTRSSEDAKWVSKILLGCGLSAAVLLLVVIYRNFRIARQLRAALAVADRTRDELFRSNQTLESVLDHVPQGIAWKDTAHRYVGGNEIYARDAGLLSKRVLIGLTERDLKWQDDVSAVENEDAKIMAGELTKKHVERVSKAVDGREVWISETKLPLEDQSGNVIGVLRAYDDITERRKTDAALLLQGRALEASVNGIIIFEARDGKYVVSFANEAFERMTGYDRNEVLNLSSEDLFSLSGESQKWDVVRKALGANAKADVTLHCVRKDRSRFWSHVQVSPVRDDGGRITHHVGVMTDITALTEYQQRLEHQAKYDALTDLPNRTLLDERLAQSLSRARVEGSLVSVMFLDLDRFKEINDSLGHRVGDALLVRVATRVRRLVRERDLIARYGGDEFVIVVEHTEARYAVPMLDRIVSAMAEPFHLDAQELYVEASIGVSTYPQDGLDADTLLRNADTAMYLAKSEGRNGYRFYRPELNAAAAERLQLSARLRRAVKNQALRLEYQPQVDMRDGTIFGAEALLRWHDEELGTVSPADFIPLAEQTGLIQSIGEWVLRTACQQVKTWIDLGLAPIRVSVNVSPLQLERSDIVEIVRSALQQAQIPSDYLELEVTEGALMRNVDEVARTLRELRATGVKIAIDDFGTGYSSLSYLKRFSVDRIKIDRAFVREIGRDGEYEALALAVIGIANALKFEVLAEGVELDAHRAFLLKHGCTAAQGFLFSPSVTGAAFAELLRSNTADVFELH